MSRVIKSGESVNVHDPFDGAEIFQETGDEETSDGTFDPRSSIARSIWRQSRMVRVVKDEMAELIARVESAAKARLLEVEQEKARLDEHVAAARREGWESGHKEGFQAGYEEGRQAALDSCQQILNSAKAALDEARAIRERALDEARGDLIRLAVAVAHKLVPIAVDQSGAASAILDAILQKAKGSAFAKVRVPKAVAEELGALCAPFAGAPEGVNVECIADPDLAPGDVVVETEWGIIDGRLRTRWERIMRGLDLAGADELESTD